LQQRVKLPCLKTRSGRGMLSGHGASEACYAEPEQDCERYEEQDETYLLQKSFQFREKAGLFALFVRHRSSDLEALSELEFDIDWDTSRQRRCRVA